MLPRGSASSANKQLAALSCPTYVDPERPSGTHAMPGPLVVLSALYSPWDSCSPWASCSLLGSCYPWASHCFCLMSCWWEKYAGPVGAAAARCAGNWRSCGTPTAPLEKRSLSLLCPQAGFLLSFPQTFFLFYSSPNLLAQAIRPWFQPPPQPACGQHKFFCLVSMLAQTQLFTSLPSYPLAPFQASGHALSCTLKYCLFPSTTNLWYPPQLNNQVLDVPGLRWYLNYM